MTSFSLWSDTDQVDDSESTDTESRAPSRQSIQWLQSPALSRATSSSSSSSSQKNTAKQQLQIYNPSFNTFPYEIRLQVYSHLFTRSDIPIPISTSTPLWTITRPIPPHPSPTASNPNTTALLYCSRLLNAETTPLLYSTHVFAIEIFTPTHVPISFPGPLNLPHHFSHITRMQTYRLTFSENLSVLTHFPKLKEIEFWLGFGVVEWTAFLRMVSKRFERGEGRVKKATFVLHITGQVSGEMINVWEKRRESGERIGLGAVYREVYGGVIEGRREEEGLFKGFKRKRVVQTGARVGSEGFEHPGTIRLIVE